MYAVVVSVIMFISVLVISVPTRWHTYKSILVSIVYKGIVCSYSRLLSVA